MAYLRCEVTEGRPDSGLLNPDCHTPLRPSESAAAAAAAGGEAHGDGGVGGGNGSGGSSAPADARRQLEALAEELERDLVLVGVAAIEDKLQVCTSGREACVLACVGGGGGWPRSWSATCVLVGVAAIEDKLQRLQVWVSGHGACVLACVGGHARAGARPVAGGVSGHGACAETSAQKRA